MYKPRLQKLFLSLMKDNQRDQRTFWYNHQVFQPGNTVAFGKMVLQRDSPELILRSIEPRQRYKYSEFNIIPKKNSSNR